MAEEKQGGARLSDIPTNLKQVNDLLSDMTVKLGNLAATPALRIETKPFQSIEQHMENIARLNKRWGEAIGERAKALKDIAEKSKKIADTTKRLLEREAEIQRKAQKRGVMKKKEWDELQRIAGALKEQQELEKQLKNAQEKMNKDRVIGKLLAQSFLEIVDKIGKSMISLSFDAVFGAIELVKKGFLAVYDLVDRTVKATGEFRENIGATTVGMKELEKEGWKLEGTLRGLSKAELGIGLKELGEATKSFGFADTALGKFRTTAVLAGKALGIGSQAAGAMAKQFYLAGDSVRDVETSFMDMSRAANAAGVPVSEFTKEVGNSTKFMAAFGRKARQVFLDSAAYAKRYGLSLKTLEGFVDMTDTFEGAATAAAKMNTIFGTSVNAMELMLADDPAKRLEMVRKALLSQGKTWDSLSRQERKFLAETTKISEEELQGLMASKESYADFQKRKDIAHRKEMSDQKAIQKATLMTAKTLNNWGATFDRIAAAFKPLLEDVIGKDFWGNVGKNVGLIVGRIQELFSMIRNNKDVQEFVAVLRNDFGDILGLLKTNGPMSAKTFEKISKAISSGAKFFHKFYEAAKFVAPILIKMVPPALKIFGFMVDHAGTILAIFAGLKLFALGSAVFSGISSFIALLGGGTTVMAALGAIGSAIAGVLSSIAAAAAPLIASFAAAVAPFAAAAAALVAAGAAGYAIGTALRKLFPQIDTFAQKLMDVVAGFFDNIWKKVVHTTFYKTLFGSEAAEAYDRADAQEAAYQKQLALDAARRGAPMPPQATTVAAPSASTVPVAAKVAKPAASSAAAAKAATTSHSSKPVTEVIQVNVNMDSQVAARAIVNRQKNP